MDTVEFFQQLLLAVFTVCLTTLLTILINKSKSNRKPEIKILTASREEISAYGISSHPTDKEKIEAFNFIKFELYEQILKLGKLHRDKTRNTRHILLAILFFSAISLIGPSLGILNIIPPEIARIIKNISNISLFILVLIATVVFLKANKIWKKIMEADKEFNKIIHSFREKHK